jgi:ADP-ribose pyrophosphatase YjhB (NUDIX family)
MAWHHRLIWNLAKRYWRARGMRTLGVRGLVVDGEGRVALVLHTYSDQWYFPGGGVKRNESFGQALTRELSEEIGLSEFRIERVLGVYHNTRELKDDHVIVFVARTTTPSPPIRAADPLEIQEAGWFALNCLPEALSPATARRIAEYRASLTGWGDW